MDKGQILIDYKLSKNHKRQITILAELNACSKEKIIEIITEGGYKMIFNTNGVDISIKNEEIKSQYESGKSIATLSKAYYVSQKAMRTLLGVEETEDKDKVDDKTYEKEIERSHDDIRKLTDRITKMQKHIDELEENLAAAAEQNVVLIKQIEELENEHDNDKYQQLCIKNNQLSVTIDTLIDKISMLKAVGCYGR